MSENDNLPAVATASGAAAIDPDEDLLTAEAEAEAEAEARAQPRRRGRMLGFIVFLWWTLVVIMAAMGAAGAGWIFWERFQHTDPASQQSANVSVQLADIDARLDELAQEGRRTASSVGDLRNELRATADQLQSLGQRMRRELAQLRDSGPPSERDWRLAEVEYLLRIANIRLRMERDAPAALRLLQSADDLLAELDDYSLLDVRAAIADDIASINALPGLDVNGLFLRLQALKNSIPGMPLAAVSYGIAPEPDAPETEPTIAMRVLKELTGAITVRTDLDRPAQPLLSADEAWYLEQNLRLMLEQAQIALLRASDPLYHESLHSARDWIRAYFDTDAASVQAALASIETLDAPRLTDELPDISGSLNRLLEARAAARAARS